MSQYRTSTGLHESFMKAPSVSAFKFASFKSQQCDTAMRIISPCYATGDRKFEKFASTPSMSIVISVCSRSATHSRTHA